MALSIIIPALNEANTIRLVLTRLQTLRASGTEVIVADGGSHDRTAALAAPLVDRVIISDAGRAKQMNAGVRISGGEVLLFLHADTLLPADAERLILRGLAETHRHWGRFDVQIAGEHFLLRVIGWLSAVKLARRNSNSTASSAVPPGSAASASSRRAASCLASRPIAVNVATMLASPFRLRPARMAAAIEPGLFASRIDSTAAFQLAGGCFKPALAMAFNAATRVSLWKPGAVTASASSCWPSSARVRMWS